MKCWTLGWGFFFFFLTASLAAYGSSWDRGGIEIAVEAYTTATATLDLSCIFDLSHSLQQCCILNPLRKARSQTCIFMETVMGPQPAEPQWELQGWVFQGGRQYLLWSFQIQITWPRSGLSALHPREGGRLSSIPWSHFPICNWWMGIVLHT